MKTTLTKKSLAPILKNLARVNDEYDVNYPGESIGRQPVQTVYGGAQIFKAETAARLGEISRRSMQDYAPDHTVFARALGFSGSDTLMQTVYERVLRKLESEPVEDFRIDFEDGYGNRPDDEEDADAVRTAQEVAKGMHQNSLSPFIGIRIKPFTPELRDRSLRTLDLFITNLLEASKGELPPNFVVTLPKVVSVEEVEALADTFDAIEEGTGLAKNSLKMEIMVETPQSLIDKYGHILLPKLIPASRGRCTGAHFGVYDYTAQVNIIADHQSMDHAACDFARHVMKVSFSGTGINISDGATNIMPVGPHRAEKGGTLTDQQQLENQKIVHRAWKIMFEHVNHSLRQGYYQGWDLHPAQFPVRYAAVYLFFLKNFDEASLRLRTFVERAAQATLVGDVFDDAATAQGLLNYFLKALNCGAITLEEAQKTGLTLEEIQSRSFTKILESRKKNASK
jgi:citrate lyase beta subunit